MKGNLEKLKAAAPCHLLTSAQNEPLRVPLNYETARPINQGMKNQPGASTTNQGVMQGRHQQERPPSIAGLTTGLCVSI
jgi:hypothetical protein